MPASVFELKEGTNITLTGDVLTNSVLIEADPQVVDNLTGQETTKAPSVRAVKESLATFTVDTSALATKAELIPLATKAELTPLATKAELIPLATKAELIPLATKAELDAVSSLVGSGGTSGLSAFQELIAVPSISIPTKQTVETTIQWDGPPDYCKYTHVDPVGILPLGISYLHYAEEGSIKLHISNDTAAAITIPAADWRVTALLDIPAEAHTSAGTLLKNQLLDGTMNAAALETAMATPETQAAFTELMNSMTRRRELFNDPEAMAAIAGSSAAIAALIAITPAFNDLLKTNTAAPLIAGSTSAINTLIADTAATTRLAASTTFMTAIAASSVAMNIIANHEPTLIIFKASSVASGALMASEAAMNILLSTPLGEQYFGDDFVGICMMNPGLGVNGWVRINKDGNTLTMADPNTYFASHNLFATTEEIIDGQVMVKFKKGYAHAWTGVAGSASAGKLCLGVSSRPINSSWLVHPAFYNYDTGSEIEQFWMGKYEGSLNETKLESLNGKTVKNNCTANEVDTWINNRNTGGVTGFHCLTFYESAWLDLLNIIKECTGDLKTKLGYGAANTTALSGSSAINVLKVSGWRANYYTYITGLLTDSNTYFTVWTPGSSNKAFTTLGFGSSTAGTEFKAIRTGASSVLGGRDMALLLLSDCTGSVTHITGDQVVNGAPPDFYRALIYSGGLHGSTYGAASTAGTRASGRLAKW